MFIAYLDFVDGSRQELVAHETTVHFRERLLGALNHTVKYQFLNLSQIEGITVVEQNGTERVIIHRYDLNVRFSIESVSV